MDADAVGVFASGDSGSGKGVARVTERRRLPTIVTGLLALGLPLLLVTTGSPAAAAPVDTYDVPANGKVTVRGHGFGHGHGMSQYGAQGAARQGLGWQQILDFYYPGTARSTNKARVRVRISVTSNRGVVVAARSGLKVRAHARGITKPLPTNVTEGTPKRWRLVSTKGGRTKVQFQRRGWHTWWKFDGEGSFRAGGRPITLHTTAGTTRYRGRLVLAGATKHRTDTINDVGLDNYVKGVIPKEMPPLWHENAVRAQAVAARTYASYEMAHPKGPHYQLCDTSSCQVYGGYDAEHPAANAAVKATRRVVLTHDGKPAFTQFGSSSGGWTAANQFSYLPAKADPYDDWSGNPVHAWTVATTAARIEAAWPGVGELQRIRILQRDGNGDWGGRVRTLRLIGSAGRVDVSGDSFRFALGLRSTWFRFR